MNSVSKINNKQLLEDFSLAVLKEREAISEVISYLSHIWERKLYAELGYSSLFNFLVEKHHYSKAAAYRRIQAAKLVQREPKVLIYLKEGKLNLTTIALIEPFATGEKLQPLIQFSLGKTKEEVEELLGEFSHKVQINKDKIRRLPVIKSSSAAELKCIELNQECFTEDVSQKNPEIPQKSLVFSDIATTTSEPKEEIRRVKIEFVADEAVAQKIERAKQILRHKYPQGKLEDIVNEALESLLEKKDPERKIKRHSEKNEVKRRILAGSLELHSRDDSRYIPKVIQREAYQRDEGKCSYVSPEGKQCRERNFLELDHIHPWSLGGTSTSENLRLLCRTHNQYRNQTLRV